MALRVRVLGAFEVEGVGVHDLGARKSRTALKVLALSRGRPVSVDRLVECLWPGQPPARPAAEVSVLVSRLRSVLGAERLVRSDAGYRLDLDWLDLDALDELVAEASACASDGSWARARAAAEAALALDRGELLADEPDADWAEPDRVAAGRLLAQARRAASLAALAVGDHVASAGLSEQAREGDPYDEEALRVLMAALTAASRPASALAAYARVRARLGEDLGVGPAVETEAVHAAILREQPIPGMVIGVAARPRSLATEAAGDESSFAGREVELGVLDAALARAAAGRLSIVAVEGEAGIGKSRLLTAWSAGIRAGDTTVLAGRCDDLDLTLPLAAILDAVNAYLRGLGADTAQLLGSDAVLGSLLGVETMTPSGGPLSAMTIATMADPAVGQVVLFDALLGVVRRIAQGGPVVMLLDDAHLAGASTIDWLRFAAQRAPDLPLLIVAARRPEEGRALPSSELITLGPLDRQAVEEVVGADRAEALFARSGGHPMFLIELAAADTGDEFPTSIRQAVAERCDRAGPATARTLRTAAVIGPEVDLDLLAGVLLLPPVELLDHVEEGVRRHLLVESEHGFSFRHDLVREALVASTGASRRALIHREAGRALAARAHPDPLAVAYHARLGGDEKRAAVALTEAAALAWERHDQAEAERRLDQAVALDDVPAIRLARARGRILSRDFTGAIEDAQVALGQGGGAPALEVAGWAAYHTRDFAAARRLADDGARLADDPALRASCLSLAGQVRTASGDLEGAESRLEEAARLARGANAVVASGWLGTLRVYQGRAEEGLELLHAAAVPGVGSAGFFRARAMGMAGYALALLGRADEALAAFDGLESDLQRQGWAGRYLGLVQNSRGWILRNLGDTLAADDANRLGVETGARVARTEPKLGVEQQVHGLLDLTAGRLQAGDLDAARSHLAAVEPLQRLDHSLHWRHELRARLLSGRLALAEGDLEAARTLAALLADEARGLHAARYSAMAGILESQAQAAAGEPIEMEEAARLVESLPRLAGLEAWWLTAEMASATGNPEWWALAERRAAALARSAGPHAETLRRYADARLESMRTAARPG